MTEQGSLTGRNEKTIDIERKEGLLDELNLPPHIIKFINKNSRNLQIVAGCIVLLIFSWTYYDYYSQNKENNASSALSAAVKEVDVDKRVELLQGVVNDFSGTDAALWSLVEQAHVAFAAGNYDSALALYSDVFGDLAKDSPLRPLLCYNMGLAYENNGDVDNALIYYAKLASFKGFEIRGLMAQGRIHEAKGENTEAIQVYNKASEIDNPTGQEKSILTEKINSLSVGGTATKKVDE